MNIIYLLIPLSLLLVGLVAAVLIWAVRSGQYEDLEGPAHRVLMDDEITAVHDDPEQRRSGTGRH